MIAFAARYGHQQLPVLGAQTHDDLHSFNDAVEYWIEQEGKNGRTYYNSMAEGGG